MSPTAASPEVLASTHRPRSPERVVGATALALGLSVAVQNVVVIVTGSPSYASPMSEVLAFHTEHRAVVAVAVGLEALNVPLLLVLVVGLHGLVLRRGGAGVEGSRLALVAGSVTAAVLVLYAVLWDGVVLAADGLRAPSPVLEMVWQLHAAAFALAMPALGATLAGAAVAAHAAGLAPSWLRPLALAGAALLVLAGTASLAIADGSPLLLVGMPGYAVWLVWLLATGVRLVRAPSR
ncbi:hypothetical protein [Nocardioides zeicaulis]|uniref:DUF4386 family protein n=1 Tax=Nocardioides zeicaulis TaxID=1776857 RepID=A0ABV6E5M2_9ACTN